MINTKRIIITLAVLFSATAAYAAVPQDTKITLERTACLGTCPVYSLTVYADGRVEFTGKQFVTAMGLHKKTVPVKNVEKILAVADRMHFFDLTGQYNCYTVTDMPSVNVTITAAGRTKAVDHYYGCVSLAVQTRLDLVNLKALESTIDKMAGVSGWLRGSGS